MGTRSAPTSSRSRRDVYGCEPGRVRLRAGTLYAALDRLRAERLITVDHDEIVEGRLRRYYRLMSAGEAQLTEEAARSHANADTATSRLVLSGGVATT